MLSFCSMNMLWSVIFLLSWQLGYIWFCQYRLVANSLNVSTVYGVSLCYIPTNRTVLFIFTRYHQRAFLSDLSVYPSVVFPSFCFFTFLFILASQFDAHEMASHWNFISFLKLTRLSIFSWAYLPCFLCLLSLWVIYLPILM